MKRLIEIADPVEVAALWSLGHLAGDDIATVSLRWLEADIDRGDTDVAALAGEAHLNLSESGPAFARALRVVAGREVEGDEAVLRALRLHLAWAQGQDDIEEAVRSILARFVGLSERRLVRNPRRTEDQRDQRYAEDELGLEYVYGLYHEFDDIGHLSPSARAAAEANLRAELREAVVILHDHLSAMLAAGQLSDL